MDARRRRILDTEDSRFTDEEIEILASRVYEKFQAQIGATTIRIVIWAISIGVLAFLTWLGIIKSSRAAQIAFHL
jgi:hypothetical protein